MLTHPISQHHSPDDRAVEQCPASSTYSPAGTSISARLTTGNAFTCRTITRQNRQTFVLERCDAPKPLARHRVPYGATVLYHVYDPVVIVPPASQARIFLCPVNEAVSNPTN
jgi:hypothetical protein